MATELREARIKVKIDIEAAKAAAEEVKKEGEAIKAVTEDRAARAARPRRDRSEDSERVASTFRAPESLGEAFTMAAQKVKESQAFQAGAQALKSALGPVAAGLEAAKLAIFITPIITEVMKENVPGIVSDQLDKAVDAMIGKLQEQRKNIEALLPAATQTANIAVARARMGMPTESIGDIFSSIHKVYAAQEALDWKFKAQKEQEAIAQVIKTTLASWNK